MQSRTILLKDFMVTIFAATLLSISVNTLANDLSPIEELGKNLFFDKGNPIFVNNWMQNLLVLQNLLPF